MNFYEPLKSLKEYKTNDNYGFEDTKILIPSKEGKYPVLYLLHGIGGYGEWWDYGRGRIEYNINDWVEKKLFNPMIIVIPSIPKLDNEYKSDAFMRYVHNSTVGEDKNNLVSLKACVELRLKDKVLNEPKNTAIAGFSMGGATALYAAVKYKDKFGHVGAFSPSELLYKINNNAWINNSKELILNNAPSSIQFIGCGSTETNFKSIKELYIEKFKENGMSIKEYVNEGSGHDFVTFNNLLLEFLKYRMFG